MYVAFCWKSFQGQPGEGGMLFPPGEEQRGAPTLVCNPTWPVGQPPGGRLLGSWGDWVPPLGAPAPSQDFLAPGQRRRSRGPAWITWSPGQGGGLGCGSAQRAAVLPVCFPSPSAGTAASGWSPVMTASNDRCLQLQGLAPQFFSCSWLLGPAPTPFSR